MVVEDIDDLIIGDRIFVSAAYEILVKIQLEISKIVH